MLEQAFTGDAVSKKWKQTTLGKVCEVIAGQSPKGSNYNDSGDGLAFYQGKKEFGGKYLGAPVKWTTQITREAVAGDILMSVRAPVGPINFATERICIGRGLASIRATGKIDRNFLFYLLLSMPEKIKGNEGAVFASISKEQIENILFSKPPIFEQVQIVAILDEAFTAIETAIANTKKNIANARALFESQLGRMVKGDALSKKWKQTTLGKVCEVIAGQSPKGSNYNDSGDGLPFYQGKKKFGCKYLGAPVKWTTQITQEAIAGDILMSVRAPVGPVNFATERICIGRGLASIRATGKIDRNFLFYLLLAMQEKIKGNEGAVFASISKEQIANIMFNMPPLPEQKRIVATLNKVSANTTSLVQIGEQKLTHLAELKQSLLQQAFTGELTADIKVTNHIQSEVGV